MSLNCKVRKIFLILCLGKNRFLHDVVLQKSETTFCVCHILNKSADTDHCDTCAVTQCWSWALTFYVFNLSLSFCFHRTSAVSEHVRFSFFHPLKNKTTIRKREKKADWETLSLLYPWRHILLSHWRNFFSPFLLISVLFFPTYTFWIRCFFQQAAFPISVTPSMAADDYNPVSSSFLSFSNIYSLSL